MNMKSFKSGLKTDRLKIEILVADSSKDLQNDMNEWFKNNSVELVSIEYTNNESYIRAFILYK